MRARTLAIVGVGTLVALYFFRSDLRDLMLEWQKSQLPDEISRDDLKTRSPSPFPSASPRQSATPVPFAGINLAVPFSPQAPFGNWELPYGEACEETSAILVDHFYRGTPISPEIAKQEIDALVAWQQQVFGYYKHTTAAETAQILKRYFGYARVDVEYDATIETIRNHVIAGRPVIVPLAGRLLGNPNYRRPGPPYHMLVVKGFTKDGDVITNDVGTSRGHNYVYKPDVFLNAMHDVPSGGDDWPAGVDPASYILTGNRAIVVVYPNKSQ